MAEPLPRYPVFERVPQKNNYGLTIAMIIMVILVIVTCVIIYAIYGKGTGTVINQCEPGLCVIDLATGQKICPTSNTQQLTYTPVFQDCTSANYCQSRKAPCAVTASGTLNCNGYCGIGNDKCNCQAAPI